VEEEEEGLAIYACSFEIVNGELCGKHKSLRNVGVGGGGGGRGEEPTGSK
jgi:hypothetical protein